MNLYNGSCELLISLTLQCTLLLLVTHVLTSGAVDSTAADRLWGRCHFYVLLLCLAGVFLPHLRPFDGTALLPFTRRVAQSHECRQFVVVVHFAWLAGALLLGLRMTWYIIWMTLQIRRSPVFSVPMISQGAAGSVPESIPQFGGISTRILCSDQCVTPYCWQLHSPVIVLPDAISSFPTDELDAVLRHELAHLQYQHPLRLFLQRLVEIGFWFHPLVWISSREASLQRELATDRHANSSDAQVAVFLKAMLRLTDLYTASSSRLPAGLRFRGDGGSMIRRRVDELLLRNQEDRDHASPKFASTFILTATAIISLVLWIPFNAESTGRTLFSPWPHLSASVLNEFGITVRDYELDSHRIQEHGHVPAGY